jgi:hypothetical protein
VTFPDTPDIVEVGNGGTPCLMPSGSSNSCASSAATSASSREELKFQQKVMSSASKTKVVTDAFTAEQASQASQEMKRLQAGEISYQENTAQAQMRARLDMENMTAEKSLNMMQVRIRSIF